MGGTLEGAQKAKSEGGGNVCKKVFVTPMATERTSTPERCTLGGTLCAMPLVLQGRAGCCFGHYYSEEAKNADSCKENERTHQRSCIR
jgi:hypothetical protein